MTKTRAPSESLPRRERIARRRDFLEAYQSGRKEVSRYTVIFARENALGHPRLGITATKKIGKSNVRNKLRRWVREVYRHQRAPLGLDRVSLDLVVNLKASSSAASFQQFSDDLTRALRRFRPRG